jgi:hypothetical protein
MMTLFYTLKEYPSCDAIPLTALGRQRKRLAYIKCTNDLVSSYCAGHSLIVWKCAFLHQHYLCKIVLPVIAQSACADAIVLFYFGNKLLLIGRHF